MVNLPDGTSLRHLRKAAETFRDYVSGRLGEIVGTVADALEEIAEETSKKADKAWTITFSVAPEDWIPSDNIDFPYQCRIENADIRSTHYANVLLDAVSASEAYCAGVSSACETSNGFIMIWSHQLPTITLSGNVYIVDTDTSENVMEDT